MIIYYSLLYMYTIVNFTLGKKKKKICVIPVTCLKILGSVGRTFFFFLRSHGQTFFQLILLLLHLNNSDNSTNR